ncbi:signal-transduction protein [Candidatus Caldarchaeum subterraneum]|uniref:Signal-transduction protein n=1 Tax=Caldiarchaeum subterraneum TaxID=311458 RepID=E6N5G2_CALS0|nr:signal-transduction protein [Candidatus Caldarchaeum subterraneum]BAJ49332.1 signal-transduction protein [Candidatus Caldarchaeum subterraneum]BAJ50347.1 signal-transduction protein [Candidatus Caldarchaeum subterraneum]
MLLKQLVRRGPITIDSSATLYDVVRIMAEQNIGFIVVLENGRMVGVLSERDVVRTLAERRDFGVKVGEICKRDIITLPADASVEDAAEEMGRHRIRHIVVVDNAGKLVGVVSARDVLQELYAQESGTD